MKWRDSRQSDNIEDMRSQTSSASLGAIIPIIRFLLQTKIGRIILVLGVVAYFMGFNPLNLLNIGSSSNSVISRNDEESAKFVSAVLAQTEDIWAEIFSSLNSSYIRPKLVLFRGAVNSGCGYASSQTGPFYCPNDQKVYLDLSFFQELQNTLNSPGDFARAYVVAHEVGHHVQNLFGTLRTINRLKDGKRKEQQNALQVRVELQADCYAGIWAHFLDKDKNLLEDGDIDEALNAASQIGDDALQKQSQGYVVPDSFTHGTSKQRKEWFYRGFKSGNISACDTGI